MDGIKVELDERMIAQETTCSHAWGPLVHPQDQQRLCHQICEVHQTADFPCVLVDKLNVAAIFDAKLF